MKPRVIIAIQLAILLIPLSVFAGKYSINWTPKKIDQTMGFNANVTVEGIILSCTEDLGSVELWPVLEIAPFIIDGDTDWQGF